jgi:methylenetetrahydrofolate dehydrogenase (NADP+)/methenyltetrahydrofolate cyclohydrolase
VANLLLQRHATVTICHSKTTNLKEITLQADILIAAVGRPHFVGSEMVKEGAVVIDVGINRVDGKLVGDVEFDPVAEKAAFITPVPGGVGPMTIALLMKNTLKAFKATL